MEPNPSIRRSEDFPKTTTMPEQWITDALMDAYNPPSQPAQDEPVPDTGMARRYQDRACETVRDEFVATSKPVEEESPFARRLDPFPARSEQDGAYL